MAVAKNQSEAFIGNGKVYLTPVKNGVAGKPFWVGVASAASFSHTVEDEKTMKEYHSGKSQDWDKDDGSKKTTFSITLGERRLDAMKAALQATETKVSTGTATDEEHAFTAAGDVIFLKHQNVTEITAFSDSTTTQALALVEDTDYKIDKKYGTIELLESKTLTSPLKITYSYGTATKLKPMTDDIDYYRIRVDGLNKVGQKDKQVIQAFQAKFKPADTYDLIGDDFASMDLEASLMFDDVEEGTYEIIKL